MITYNISRQQSFPSAPNGNTHLSIRRCIMYVNTILCSCTVLELLPFYHRVTAHVRNRGRSIHHLTSLHHDDTAGRYKGYITFKTSEWKSCFSVAVSGSRIHLKNMYFNNKKKSLFQKNTVPGFPLCFQK